MVMPESAFGSVMVGINGLAVILNLASLLLLGRVNRASTSEVVILMGTLALVSCFGCSLLVLKILEAVTGKASKQFVDMFCLHVPVCYNIFLPAILAKLGSFVARRPKSGRALCDFSYAAVCVGCLAHVVVILSPMPAFDYHKFQSVHVATDKAMSHEINTPVLMITGAVPQLLGVLASLKLLSEICSAKCDRSPKGTINGSIETSVALLRRYLKRWGMTSCVLILPSSLTSVAGYLAYRRGSSIPQALTYTQAVADVAIFFTQPFFLLLLFAALPQPKTGIKVAVPLNGLPSILPHSPSSRDLHSPRVHSPPSRVHSPPLGLPGPTSVDCSPRGSVIYVGDGPISSSIHSQV